MPYSVEARTPDDIQSVFLVSQGEASLQSRRDTIVDLPLKLRIVLLSYPSFSAEIAETTYFLHRLDIVGQKVLFWY